MAITLNKAITRIQGIYDFDCKCVKQVKAFRGTKDHTKGPQSAVSSVVLEDEKRIFECLKEIKNVLSQHAPQFLEVFKLKSLLALIVANFLSEMSATGKISQFPSMFFLWSFHGFPVVNRKIPLVVKVPFFHLWLLCESTHGYRVFQMWKFFSEHISVKGGNSNFQQWKLWTPRKVTNCGH